jgi:putative membrane protein
MNNLKNNNWFVTLIFSLIIVFYSCSNSRNNDTANNDGDSKKMAEDHNDAKFAKAGEKDAQFLVDAATLNFNEIQLGNLAETKAVQLDVKNLGKMLQDDHSKAQSDLISLAQKKGISIPTTTPNESMSEYNDLKDKNNKDFDSKYIDMMVKGHTDAISKFEKATTDCEDADVRDWATKMLPKLREHLDLAMNCQTKLKTD